MEPISSRASPPSYKLTEEYPKRSSENPHSGAFPAIVLLETDKPDFLGFPGTDTLSSNITAKDVHENFSWRFSLTVPNFDHSVLHLDLCMTKSGNGGKEVNTVLLSVDIPDTETVGIHHSHLNAGQITRLYRKCGQTTEATVGAENLEVEVKEVFPRCRLGRYDIQLSAPAKALVTRIKEQISCVKKTDQTCFAIRFFFPTPKAERSHPIETWIALLLDTYSRNKQSGGPFKPYNPQSRSLLSASRLPHTASIRATPRFWSKDQYIVYLRYGLATNWERKSGRDEAVRLSISPDAVAIPVRFHDTSGDPIEYILVVKTASLDPDSRRQLPRLRSKVRIQAAVKVTRGFLLYDDLFLGVFTGEPLHAQNTDIWCSAERISLPSSKWSSSCHIYRMRLPISDTTYPWKNGGVPVKLKFPEFPLDLTEDQVKERVMSGDYDIKIVIDHETEWDFRIRALQKIFFDFGPSASQMSRHAVEDYRMMSPRHYTILGSRFPALARTTSETRNQQKAPWVRANHNAPSPGQMRLIQKISESPHFYVPIVGGPGTGKTTTMIFHTMLAAMEPLYRPTSERNILRPFAKILVQAGTNSTCDDICARYVAMAKAYNPQKSFQVLRLFDVRDVLEWARFTGPDDSDVPYSLSYEWGQEQLRRQRAMIQRICQEWKRQEHSKVSSPTTPGSSSCRSSVTLGDPDGFHHKTANSSHQTRVSELTLEGLIAKRLRQPVEKLNNRDAELKRGIMSIMRFMENKSHYVLCGYDSDIYWLAREIVLSTQVVVGTPAAICASSKFQQLFRADICVHEDTGSSSEVDTMCLIAEQDPLACFLVGDPDQQEPAFFSKRVNGDARFKVIQESNPFASQLQTSLLQRMVASCMIPNDEYLCADHRSNGLVSDVVSKVFYGNRIMAMQKNPSPSPTQTLFKDLVAQKYGQELSGFAIMIDVKHSKEISSAEGYYNPKHIDEGCQLLQTILRPLCEQFLRDHTDPTRPFSAGVVTPYNSSVTEWEKAIEDAGICHMEAHTPGTMPERDFVMVDLVRSDDSGNTGDRSLLISTLSRAKSCMVVLVNTNTLRKTYTPWLARVVNYFKGKKRFIEA